VAALALLKGASKASADGSALGSRKSGVKGKGDNRKRGQALVQERAATKEQSTLICPPKEGHDSFEHSGFHIVESTVRHVEQALTCASAAPAGCGCMAAEHSRAWQDTATVYQCKAL